MACSAPTVIVANVEISTSDLENASTLIDIVSGDNGDPTLDEYTENIGNGNNGAGTTGIQLPSEPAGTPPAQTSLPTPSPIPADISIVTPAKGGNGQPVSPSIWTGNYNDQLSTNFTVKDFTVGALFPNPLTDYNATYTAQVRFNNLRGLAINIAEPLRARYGPFRINSGIRNKTSTPPPRLSQHITGQAMDVQFAGWSYARYWENAQWVRDNLQFDQFIFEHSDKTGLAWFHLSFNLAGNRAITERTKVMTMYRNHFDTGLHNHGSA